MSGIKKFVTGGSTEILEIRELYNLTSASSCEVEIEITGNRDVLHKLKSKCDSCYILEKASEKAVIDGVANAAFKEYTTYQSLVRSENYVKIVAMRVELEEALRKVGWRLQHRQQGDGFKPQWVVHMWEKGPMPHH